MGSLAKIEAGKNSSDAYGGCAVTEWLTEKASDFAKWVAKGVFDIGKQVLKNVQGFLAGNLSWLFDGIKGATDKVMDFIPGARFVQRSFGVMVSVGKSVTDVAGGCIREVLTGLGVVGAVAGGAAAVSALGGLGAIMTGLAVVGAIGATARWFLRGAQKMWNFNWNITEKQIQDRYKNNIRNLSARLGGVVGTGLATLACGVAPGAAIVRINPLALALVKETIEDGWDELKGQINGLIQTTVGAAQEWIVLELFKNSRSLIKRIARSPGIKDLLPAEMQKAIQDWGSEGSKPWSFASAVDDAIEGIANPNLQAFTEELVEEFLDVCAEQTYALTYAL